MRFSFFFAGGKTEERGKIEEESSEGTKEFFFFEGGKKRLISRTNMLLRIAKEKESMLEWSEWNFASLSLFFLKSCFVKYSHEKFLLFKVKLSSSLAQRNIYHFCVSISLFLLQKTLLFSDLKFIYVHNTTRLKIIEILYVTLFNCDKTSKENWISRERLQRPPKQESQRPKANFKGSLRRRGQRSIGGD